ncbi:unnamed protein product [Dibothriocephalus latus]|uniref:Uncharacterized protein n=1 Tax=Dibothriocephalus latus TaxID=60516 RepID=A0A3P7MM81_DIBLA|nr:unnamed protein product [Dibothriocephalus latus]
MEHNVDHNGDLKVQVQSEQEIFELSTFFTETPANKAAPRTILIDSEPSVLGRTASWNKQPPKANMRVPGSSSEVEDAIAKTENLFA